MFGGGNHREKKRKKHSALRDWGSSLLWALVLAAILRASVAGAYFVPSGSMEPGLLIGDHLLAWKAGYDLKLPFTDLVLWHTGEPRRGDVVVFTGPLGEGTDLVKRVMALPGETVETRGRQVLINGRVIEDPWGRYGPGPGRGQDYGPVKVPADSYFVLGDNRDNSYDSRFWNQGRGGFVPREAIRGKVLAVLWSWKKFPSQLRWGRTGKLIL